MKGSRFVVGFETHIIVTCLLGFLNKAEKKGNNLFDEETEPTGIKSSFIEEVTD
jgi:hypothetical protein